MVGGQAIDLRAAAQIGDPITRDTLRDMHARKTGALIRAAVLGGATMAGASRPVHEALDVYASQVGLAFQIVDDILDVEGSSADLGKTAGKDAAAGKPTYPALFGLEPSRRLAAECIDRALGALNGAGLSGYLPALAQWVTSRHS
jgi:geranylgeranyl pyrophosphate synthase